MGAKKNCWECKNCGRQPGGAKVAEFGVCVAACEPRLNGVHDGVNGGRACWAIAGTLCGGKVQGSFATKLVNCQTCAFYQEVVGQEGGRLMQPRAILAKLQ